MQKLIAVLLAIVFVACGDTTGPDGLDIPDGPLQMALVQGGGQEVTVTDTLPTDIVVQVEKGGEALPDQLVDWTVLHDNCGSPFVTTTRTDAEGQTGNRLVAGTRAWTRPDGPDVCQMEVRYALTVADTVQARVDTTVTYLVQPGKIAENSLGGMETYSQNEVTVDADYVVDQYGNPTLWRLNPHGVAHTASSDPGDAGARTLVLDSAGTARLDVMHADTVLCSGWVEGGGNASIRANFDRLGDTTSTCPR